MQLSNSKTLKSFLILAALKVWFEFGHKKHLVRVRKRSRFAVKYPVSLPKNTASDYTTLKSTNFYCSKPYSMAELPFLCSMLRLLALETMHEAVNKPQHQILQTEKHTSVTQYVMYVFMCYKHLSFSICVCVCV